MWANNLCCIYKNIYFFTVYDACLFHYIVSINLTEILIIIYFVLFLNRQQWHFLTILCFSDVSPEIKAPELKRFSSRVSEEITNISNSAQIACNHLSFQLFFFLRPYDLINAICISFSCLYSYYISYVSISIWLEGFQEKYLRQRG